MYVCVSCRYAIIHEAACVQGQEIDLTSADVASELQLWEPTDDYGTDDWFSITPPKVSQRDQEIYRKACEVTERGSPRIVPAQSLELYSKYIKKWCDA